jgi:hypothetical protein
MHHSIFFKPENTFGHWQQIGAAEDIVKVMM